MLSLDLIRHYPDLVRQGLRHRGWSDNLEEILRLGEQRDGLLARCEGLYTTLKTLREDLKKASAEQRASLQKRIKAISSEIRRLEVQIADLDTQLHLLVLRLPNLPHRDLPAGKSSSANRELRRWGTPLSFYFTPRSSWELGRTLGILDLEAGRRLAGSHFAAFQGTGARLLRSLGTLALDIYTRELGYREALLPSLLKHGAVQAAAHVPLLEEQTYSCQADELYLNPGGETPLIGLYSDTILPVNALPVRAVTWSQAFRRDAEIPSPRTSGLLPLHQFNEIQLFQLVAPGDSYTALQLMVAQIESLLQRLELAYRVVLLCAGRLSFAATMTISLEAWLPAQRHFVQVATVSNYEAFQTRRANILYRPANDSRTEYAHSLGACAPAIERLLAVILEVYQQADGTVVVPKILRPYMGLSLLSP
jgi:seryl-tRNA synthetase